MNSIAAAKRRRAGIQPNTPQVTNTPPPPPQNIAQPQPKINLMQFLSNVDKKMSELEAKIPKEANFDNIKLEIETAEGKTQVPITEYMETMDSRFQILAEEIATVKDIVLKLQSFTMEVNQKLLHEITSGSQPITQEEIKDEPKDEPQESFSHKETIHQEEPLTIDTKVEIDSSNQDMDVEIVYGSRQNKKKNKK